MTGLRVTILGSGSVGLAVAATFAAAGVGVTVLARGPVVAQLRETGITVSGVAGEHHIEPDGFQVSDAENPDPQDTCCDILIVATKAYQVQAALAGLMQRAGVDFAPKAVLLLQNGWGSAHEVQTILPASVALFSSIMMIGMARKSQTHIHVNVQASPIRIGTLFGCADGAMRQAVERGQSGFLPMVYEEAIEAAILNKFLFNTCLNALGALTQMTFGELVGNAHTLALITSLAQETVQVVQRERNHCLAQSGKDYVEKSLLPLVLPRGAAHRSSMFQDVEAGRKTEIG
jgi:2-dehydropantoate 2-reductase